MSARNPNNVMVTGAGGLIGSHLIERLLASGHTVYALDVVPLEKSNNLREVAGHPNFHYTLGDIRDEAAVRDFFRKDASVVYHLASVVGVRHYMEDPFHLIDIAIIGTRNLLQLCIEHSVRVLFTSTSEVYGKNPNVPWRETDDRVLGSPDIDRWIYSTSKALIEHLLFGLHHSTGFPFSTVRFFNVYGPRQNPIYVVSQSVYRALRGETPDIYDGGTQTRCFTYIDDVIDGVIAAATKPEAIGHVFNLGNEVETDMRTVVEHCIEAAGGDITANEIDTVQKYGSVYQDIGRRVPDSSKAREMLGWTARTQVREGIEKTITWARKNPWYLQ